MLSEPSSSPYNIYPDRNQGMPPDRNQDMPPDRKHYTPPTKELWQGRVDPAPSQLPIPEEFTHRIHQRIQFLDLSLELPPAPSSHSMVILGFRSDIGVTRNQGRPGAADAPPAIRKAMANLAWHFPDSTFLFDAGDIQPVAVSQPSDVQPVATSRPGDVQPSDIHPLNTSQSAANAAGATSQSTANAVGATSPETANTSHTPDSLDPLAEAQNILAAQITRLHKAGYTPILLGGGHEIAKPHFLGTTNANKDHRIGIINIDAHFDLREDPNAPTSGTSFLEIYQHQQKTGKPFDYLVLGLQNQANTRALYETARQTGARYLQADQLDDAIPPAEPYPYQNPNPPTPQNPNQQPNLTLLESTLQSFTSPLDGVCLTLCMDVIDASFAPGVSAPVTPGLFPAQLIALIKKIFSITPVLSFDIAEVNPQLDPSQRTEKLAARLITEIIHGLSTQPLKTLKTT